MRSFFQMTASLFLFTVGAAGCGAEDTIEEDEATDTVEQESITSNSLAANAVVANAVVANAVVANAVVANALNSAALGNIADLTSALANTTPTGDPDYPTKGHYAQKVLEYIYGCAMPSGSTLVLNLGDSTFTAEGYLGLAPEWGTSSCDNTCKEWVSACVLARVNGYGVPINISLRGDHAALNPGSAERNAYTKHEGRFWGKLFDGAVNNEFYACTGTDSSTGQLTGRVCAAPGGDCGIQVVGACSDHCNANGWCRSDAEAGTYRRAIGTWLKPPPPNACGNGVCEVGETSGSCSLDCPAFTASASLGVAGTKAPLSSAHSGTDGVFYAGVTTASTTAANLLGGLPAQLNPAPLSTRDMFIVRSDPDGNALKARRIAVGPGQSPLALRNDGGKLFIASSLTLRALAGVGLQSIWTVDQTSESSTRMSFSSMIADGKGVHVVGAHQSSPNGGGSWTPTSMGYRKYSLSSGALLKSSTTIPFTSSTVLGLINDCQFSSSKPDSAGTALVVSVHPTGNAGCIPGGETFTRSVPGMSDPAPVLLAGNLFVAGKSKSKAEVFLGKPTGGQATWSWIKRFVALGEGSSLAIKSMQVVSESLVVSGTYSGSVDFRGDGPSVAVYTGIDYERSTLTSATDGFIAAYDVSNGALRWVRSYGGPGNDAINAVAVTQSNTVWGFGSFTGTALFEGEYLSAIAGALDADPFRVGVGPLKLVPANP
jgi:hypothetical protein